MSRASREAWQRGERKPKKKKLPPPPLCAHCSQPAHLVTGREVYPHRPELYDRSLWKCTPCNAWVGCHKGGTGTRALGRPADLELRNARTKLHARFDPIWQTAVDSGAYAPEDQKAAFIIRAAARSRTYAYLAARMGLKSEDCHIAMFTLDQCRIAWVALRDLTYPMVRNWYRAEQARQLLAGTPTAAEIKHLCLDHCEGCRTVWRMTNGHHPDNAGRFTVACQAIGLRRALTERLELDAADIAADQAARITTEEGANGHNA